MTSCAGFNASKGGKVPYGRKGLVCALLLLAATAQGDVLCGTWNLKWFPSGRAEHRASPRVEKANIADAADVVREGLGSGMGVVRARQKGAGRARRPARQWR